MVFNRLLSDQLTTLLLVLPFAFQTLQFWLRWKHTVHRLNLNSNKIHHQQSTLPQKIQNILSVHFLSFKPIVKQLILDLRVFFWNKVYIKQLLSRKDRSDNFLINKHLFIQKFSIWMTKNILTSPNVMNESKKFPSKKLLNIPTKYLQKHVLLPFNYFGNVIIFCISQTHKTQNHKLKMLFLFVQSITIDPMANPTGFLGYIDLPQDNPD